MAFAESLVDPTNGLYNPELLRGESPDNPKALGQWLLWRSLRQLLNVHSGPLLRFEIVAWIFTVPFVSRTYADPPLRRKLEAVAKRCKLSGRINLEQVDASTCYSLRIASLGIDDVCFCLTREYEVIPYPTSFEAICISLDVDPESMALLIHRLMDVWGINHLLKQDEMAVRAKHRRAACKQKKMLRPIDWKDPRFFAVPDHIKELHEEKAAKKAYMEDLAEQFSLRQLDLGL